MKLITPTIPEGFVPLKNIVPLQSEDDIKTIMFALIEVLGELHKNNLIFGNLHPDYIFVKGSQIVLAMPLVEFTIRKTLLDKNKLPFSPFYHYEQYSLLGGIKPIYDLYSLSAVLYYLIEGKSPEKEKQHSPNSIFPPLSRFTKFNELIKNTTSKSLFHKIKTLDDYKKSFEEVIYRVDKTPEPNNKTQENIQKKTTEISANKKEQLEKFIKPKKVKHKKVEPKKIDRSDSGKSYTVIKLGTKKVVKKTQNKPRKRGRKIAMIIIWIIIFLMVGSYYVFKHAGFYYDKLPPTAITSIKYYNELNGVKEIKKVIQLSKNKRAILFKDAENLDRLIVETDNITIIDTVFPTNIYVLGIEKLSDNELIYYGYNEFNKTKWQGLGEILNIKNKRLSIIDMPFFYTITGIASDNSSGLLYITGNRYTNIIKDTAYFPQYSAVSVFDVNNFEFVKDTLIDTNYYFSFVKLIGKVKNNLILYRETARTKNDYEKGKLKYNITQYKTDLLKATSDYETYLGDYVLMDTFLISMNHYGKSIPDYYIAITSEGLYERTIYPGYFSKLFDKKASIKYEDINDKGNILVGNIKKDYASKNKARGIITISTGKYPKLYNYNTTHFLLKSSKAKLYFIKEAGNKIYLYGIDNKDDENVPFRIILNKKVLYRLAFPISKTK